MMPPHEEWSLDTRRLGRRILVHDCVDSTSTLAADLGSDPAHDGTVVLARAQTAGRGQHGRRWECPPGMGVLLSVLLFPPATLRRPALLTAWATVSVCETILQATGIQTRIKWPNDVLLRGRKVAGILIEQGRSTVVGIGLNVNQSAEAFISPDLANATSLAIVTGHSFDCSENARQLIRQLDEEYDRLCQGDLSTLEACWKWRIGLLGRQVRVECLDATYHGRLREVAWSGLELVQADGTLIRLQPECVRQVLAT